MSEFRPRRAVKKAIQFNIIVVGASGLGKSTFINTLCGQNVVPTRNWEDPSLIPIGSTAMGNSGSSESASNAVGGVSSAAGPSAVGNNPSSNAPGLSSSVSSSSANVSSGGSSGSSAAVTAAAAAASIIASSVSSSSNAGQLSGINHSMLMLKNNMQINPIAVEIDEDGVKMQLTIIDTPGFGDSIDNSTNFDELLMYIERQYDDVLGEESKIKRNPRTQDTRIHVLLYFIAPTGHSLREIDIELMRRLGRRVNIIPIVARADSLTPRELGDFKRRIMEDIRAHNIQIFDFPYDEEEDDEETIVENKELREMLPFAVIGSTESVQVNGRLVRGRRYAYGIPDVDNMKHCDFSRLRLVLFSSHLVDLKEATVNTLYENYRSEKLSKLEGLAEKLSVLQVDGTSSNSNESLISSASVYPGSQMSVGTPNGTAAGGANPMPAPPGATAAPAGVAYMRNPSQASVLPLPPPQQQ